MSQRKVRIKRSRSVQVDIVIEVAEPPTPGIPAAGAGGRRRAASPAFLDVHLFSCDRQLSVSEPAAVTLPSGKRLEKPVRQTNLDREFGDGHERRCWTVRDYGDADTDPVIVIPIHTIGKDVPCPVMLCLTFRSDLNPGSEQDPFVLPRVPAGLTFLTG
jgi:hypothetical protein